MENLLEETLIEKLANKYNLPKPIIRDIIYSQFRFLKEVVTKEEKNLMLPFFGKFAIKPGRKEYWDKKNETFGDYRGKRYATKTESNTENPEQTEEIN